MGHILEALSLTVATVEKAVVQFALLEDTLQELTHVLRTEVAVRQAWTLGKLDVDEHFALAVADTPDFHDTREQRALLQVRLDALDDAQRPVGPPAGACTDEQHRTLSTPPHSSQVMRSPLIAGVIGVTERPCLYAGDEIAARAFRAMRAC